MVQIGARMVNGMNATPPPHTFHTARLFMPHVLVMHGWSWQYGECVGSKAIGYIWGGPTVGTTYIIHASNCFLIIAVPKNIDSLNSQDPSHLGSIMHLFCFNLHLGVAPRQSPRLRHCVEMYDCGIRGWGVKERVS